MADSFEQLRQRWGREILTTVGTLTVVFILLKFIGIRVTLAGLLLSIAITFAIRYGSHLFHKARAKSNDRQTYRED